jgi:hypothetical protein
MPTTLSGAHRGRRRKSMNDVTASEVREIVDRETTVVTDFESPVLWRIYAPENE